MGHNENIIGARPLRAALSLAILLLLVMGVIGQASAVGSDIITVTNGSNSGPGSLRQAVNDADPGDTIVIDFANPVIQLTSEIVFAQNLTIETDPAHDPAVIKAATPQTTRFAINHAELTLRRLKFRQLGADGPDPADRVGGVIVNVATLILDDVVFEDNAAQDYGGAIANYGTVSGEHVEATGNEALNSCGGFLWNIGHPANAIQPTETTIEHGTFIDNESAGGGGGFCNTAGSGGDAVLTLSQIVAEENEGHTGGFIINDVDETSTASVMVNVMTAVGNKASFGAILSNSGPGGSASLVNVTGTGNEALEQGIVLVTANGAKTEVAYSSFGDAAAREVLSAETTAYHAYNGAYIGLVAIVSAHIAQECSTQDPAWVVNQVSQESEIENLGGNVFDDDTCFADGENESIVAAALEFEPLDDFGGHVLTMPAIFPFGIANFIEAGEYGCGTAVQQSANGIAMPVAFLGSAFCYPGGWQPIVAEVTIKKITPDQVSYPDRFDFEILAFDKAEFFIDSGETHKILLPNRFLTFRELKAKDWVITRVDCTPSSDPFQIKIIEKDEYYEWSVFGSGHASISCTVHNRLKNRLSVTKKSDADKEDGFKVVIFDAPIGLYERSAVLKRGETKVYENLPSGDVDYVLEENIDPGWMLTSVECKGVTAERIKRGVKFKFPNNQRLDAHCTFTNMKLANMGFLAPIFGK